MHLETMGNLLMCNTKERLHRARGVQCIKHVRVYVSAHEGV